MKTVWISKNDAFWSLASCSLQKVGCSESYTGSNIQMVGTEVQGKQLSYDGFTETVCVKCIDSDGILRTKDNLSFNNRGDCASLEVKPKPIGRKELRFNRNTNP